MKPVKITLKRAYIYYDVENIAYNVGLNRNTGENFEQVANIQNKGEAEDRDFVRRSVDAAFNRLKRNVNRFLTSETATSSNVIATAANQVALEAALKTYDEGGYVLEFKMPENYNLAAVDSVKNAAHDFIVSSALYDWFTAAKPDEIAIYAARKSAANTNLLSALYRKKAPTRPA